VEIFVDTANLEEIEEVASWGVVSGVTTNPSLVAKEGRGDMESVVREIVAIVDGPISVEVLSLEVRRMVEEARRLSAISENVVVKIPMTEDGLKAVHVLSDMGIKTNVTLVFSPTQGLLASLAGATYVSPFVGRLDDAGHDGLEVVRDLAEIFATHDLDTRVITASVRHPMHVVEAALAGSDVATVPYQVLKKMVRHPLTDIGIQRFLDDWQRVRNR